jgi:hypothetical protein
MTRKELISNSSQRGPASLGLFCVPPQSRFEADKISPECDLPHIFQRRERDTDKPSPAWASVSKPVHLLRQGRETPPAGLSPISDPMGRLKSLPTRPPFGSTRRTGLTIGAGRG